MTLVLIDLNSDDPEYVSAFIERLNEYAPEDGYEVDPSVYVVETSAVEQPAVFAHRADAEAYATQYGWRAVERVTIADATTAKTMMEDEEDGE